MTTSDTTHPTTLTAVNLVARLREQGHSVLRSVEPAAWVILPRVATDDPILDWLQPLGAGLREYEPERYSKPGFVVYEVQLTTIGVEDGHGPRAIWEAAGS